MNGKPVLVAIVVVAIAAIGALVLFDVGSLFGGGGADDGTNGGGDDPYTVDVDGGADGGDGTAGDRGPALFGRAAQRIGIGDALGRVLSFESKKPVAGARVQLKGKGYGKEAVAVDATSGKDGRFHLPRVPAGEAYVLTVNAGDEGTRTVTEIGVRAGDVEDLGTIWVGESGTLEGVVVDTLDRGVRDADVQLHPGAISLESMMTDFMDLLGRLDQDPKPIARTDTDGEGRFRIAGVAPGPATLIVRKPGYQIAIKPITMSKDGVIGETPVIRLEEASPISGRVVNQDGKGVALARVALIDQGDTETGFFARQFSETDNDGYFVVDSPPNATRLVAVVAAAGYPTVVENFTADRRDGHVFTVVGGAVLTIRVKKEEDGSPIAGASVLAMLSEEPNLGAAGGNMVSGVTDGRGEVELIARPGYLPMVIVSHPEEGRGMYMPQMSGMAQLGAGMIKGPSDPKVEAGRNVIELTKPGGIVITGRVTGPDGQSIAGAEVGMGGQLAMFGGGSAVTNADGAYELRTAKLPPMFLQITVKAPGYVQPDATRTLKAAEGQPLQHDVQLDYAAQVEGVVTQSDGTPLAGVQVRLKREGGGPNPMNWTLNAQSAMTDRGGRYFFDTVQRGQKYTVIGRRDGYVDTSTKAFQVAASAEVVTAPVLELAKGVDLTLHIVEPGGRDVAGARVDVHVERVEKAEWDPWQGWRSFAKVVTNADGKATVRSVPDGKVTLTARGKGFAGARKTIEVRRATPPEGPIEISLREALTITGTVFDQNGEPVRDANVQLQTESPDAGVHGNPETDARWMDMLSDQTDAEGRFEIEGAAPVDSFKLHIFAAGYQTKQVTVRGRLSDIEITVRQIDKDKQRRIEELSKGIQDVVQKMQEAKDDEERQARIQELQEMQQELQQLQQDPSSEEPEVIEGDDG
ncbi:MAG: carboxypeptidase-like regulatory domain-containing protein [Planctomycetota bacterium]|nr:carboxypeptidase-like regulatory domain-containing protein [Planctomycetota bacterium]